MGKTCIKIIMSYVHALISLGLAHIHHLSFIMGLWIVLKLQLVNIQSLLVKLDHASDIYKNSDSKYALMLNRQLYTKSFSSKCDIVSGRKYPNGTLS